MIAPARNKCLLTQQDNTTSDTCFATSGRNFFKETASVETPLDVIHKKAN